MPELAQLLTETVTGAVQAVDDSERRALLAHVDALQKLAGKQPGTAELLTVLQAGWLPDYYAGEEITIAAQFQVSTARERTVGAGGAVVFGPLQITASYSETFRRGSQTNVAVTITLARQSRSRGIANALDALAVLPTPPVPAGPGH